MDFEDGWLIKSSYMVLNELKACQPTETKVQKKKKKKLIFSLVIFIRDYFTINLEIEIFMNLDQSIIYPWI